MTRPPAASTERAPFVADRIREAIKTIPRGKYVVKRLGEGLRNIPFAQVNLYGVARWTTGLIICQSLGATPEWSFEVRILIVWPLLGWFTGEADAPPRWRRSA
jgi:hypothetical protein